MAYPLCLADLPALQRHLVHGTQRFDGARRVAGRILTLPTHPFVTPSDIEAICAALRDVSHARSGMVAVR
jgi:dTDP-4-amino-4,6-dideoxygalactose transaminase